MKYFDANECRKYTSSPVHWSSMNRDRDKIPLCGARSASAAYIANDYTSHFFGRVMYINPLLDNEMALHVQIILRKRRQIRCAALPVSFGVQESERNEMWTLPSCRKHLSRRLSVSTSL